MITFLITFILLSIIAAFHIQGFHRATGKGFLLHFIARPFDRKIEEIEQWYSTLVNDTRTIYRDWRKEISSDCNYTTEQAIERTKECDVLEHEQIKTLTEIRDSRMNKLRWVKPLFDCPACMASLHGGTIYVLFILLVPFKIGVPPWITYVGIVPFITMTSALTVLIGNALNRGK